MPDPRCPICDRPSADAHRPFCSPAHRDRDLLQWLGEGYVLPGQNGARDGLDSGEDAD